MRKIWLVLILVAGAVRGQEAGTPEAEKALRARVEQFYRLQMDKKYRAAEKYVAEDTKDAYFGASRGDLQGFTIRKVELLDGNTKAKVSIQVKATIMMMGAGRLPVEMPAVTLWKVENGEWMWYQDPEAARQTPFGTLRTSIGSDKGGSEKGGGEKGGDATGPRPALPGIGKVPNLDSLLAQVKADQQSVMLTNSDPAQAVTVSNGLPGPIDLSLGNDRIAGVAVELDRSHLGPGENATVRIRKTGNESSQGVVRVAVSPLGSYLDIRVATK